MEKKLHMLQDQSMNKEGRQEWSSLDLVVMTSDTHRFLAPSASLGQQPRCTLHISY